jgi:hypothetical protein
MPGKKTPKSKPATGESGLNTETTSGGQAPDHGMNPDESSVAAVELPRKETTSEEEAWRATELASNSTLKAFTELYGDTPPEEDKDPLPPQHEAIDVDKDNEDKDNEEEDVFLLPESQNFAPGTAEYFTEKLRYNGLAWRHAVKQRVKKDPTLNNRPSPMDEATRPLGQMLHDIRNLRGEAEQIVDMGDGFVQMPIATFERHVYPSAYLRSYLRAMGEAEDLAGAVESTTPPVCT